MNHRSKRPAKAARALAPDRPIVLVGMMGAGKTTVGRRLAERLGLKFHDADLEIEKAAGMSVADLFLEHGEESFRRGEAQIIARLLSGPPHVLATGGGAILFAETRRLIKAKAWSVWIKADVEVLLRRATRRKTRPLLKVGDPRATLSRLLEARQEFYAQADLAIESLPGPHTLTVDAIIDGLADLMKEQAQSEAAQQ
jgi:shikimate kinase